ncbi:sensor histidine kinase [Streptomyces sp. IBSNAI002]|uniref:sensor histidine kinase n=1 Tax=Streptomyces sp. IBSNAI002 TaxID=3457500 RepID=UPI003FD0BF9E
MYLDQSSARRPCRRDLLLSLCAVLWGLADAFLTPWHGMLGQATPTAALVAAAFAGVTLWRRRFPVCVALLTLVGYCLVYVPGVVALALFTLGTTRRRGWIVSVGVGIVGLTVLSATPLGLALPNLRDYAGGLLDVVPGSLLAGYVVGLRGELAKAAQTQARCRELQQEMVTRRAIERERSRIAREMHDVVAHRVSDIVLAVGVLEVTGAYDEETVRGTLGRVRRGGQAALAELREVLGLLGPGHPGSAGDAAAAERAEAPGLAVPDLVADAVAAGRPVELSVEGYLDVLPVEVQRAVYRTVQESLTNAAKHAPGAQVRVGVRCEADGVHVEVVNGPARSRPFELPSARYGLIGLEERLRLLGGSLSAAPHGDGFRVGAFLPSGGDGALGGGGPAVGRSLRPRVVRLTEVGDEPVVDGGFGLAPRYPAVTSRGGGFRDHLAPPWVVNRVFLT